MVESLNEGEWSCYGGSHMEGKRSCQRVSGGQFNELRIVMLWRWTV